MNNTNYFILFMYNMIDLILFNINENVLEVIDKIKALDYLYLLNYRLPTTNDIINNKSNNITTFIEKYYKNISHDDIIKYIQKIISEIDIKIPLYDTYSTNMYLISKENVYHRVIHNHYRFTDEEFYKNLKNEKKNFVKTTDILEKRKQRKVSLILKYLSQFDLKILNDTYIKIFYYYANEVGKNITLCKRPSFLPHFLHIIPYYSRSELINLALNMGLIKSNSEYYDQEKVEKLCKIIRNNDISANTILKHQTYMANKNKVGIIQYYSLQGSFFMNQYLRNQTIYSTQNKYLEQLIVSMWKTINDSPEFDKSYTVYRFIEDDSYLSHLKIGDEFIDPGFISTTRDPFYNSNIFKFGFILIKINIPAHIKGVGLCIETISHFPKEEEIILSPLSILKLEKKDSNCIYYHTDNNFATKVQSRYEFTYVGKEKISLTEKADAEPKLINFLEIDRYNFTSIGIQEKIKMFTKQYANVMFQYKSNIGDKELTIALEWYDATEAYRNFYASSVQNGFLMYNIDDDNTSFTIEIGENREGVYMYVNYYFRYTMTSRNKNISEEDLIKFISSIGYFFNISTVIIYADYTSCDAIVYNSMKSKVRNKANDKNDKNDKKYYGGNYCVDFYNYIKYGIKRFKSIDTTVMRPKVGYYQLDRLKTVSPEKILNKDDKDELYQIYVKTYTPFVPDDKNNLSEFYIWIIENHCYLSQSLTQKMHRFYYNFNPFVQDYYVLDPVAYLYNKDLIASYRYTDGASVELDESVLPKNTYRLEDYFKPRVPSVRRQE